MSRWNRFGWYEAAAKKPPPERGIRMKKAGTTWWGQRWIEALQDVLRGDSARLARGRTYARAGRTHDLVVKGGKVAAKVTGSRASPYKITIELTELSAPAWKKAIDGLAKKAQFSAELLSGLMPQAIDEVFVEAGVSLFPKRRADLKTSCSCPDWGDPCKHVAATHYVLGEALDRDPFLLFELRGRTRDQVLDALRAARGSKAAPKDAIIEVPTVKLGKLKAGDYDRPREPLPTLHFSFDEPVTHGALLRQLGVPTTWESEVSPATFSRLWCARPRRRHAASRWPSQATPASHPRRPRPAAESLERALLSNGALSKTHLASRARFSSRTTRGETSSSSRIPV